MNLSQEEKKFIKMVKNEDKDLGLGIPKNHPDNELGTAKQEMKNLYFAMEGLEGSEVAPKRRLRAASNS